MEGYCEDCCYIDKTKKFDSIFDNTFTYGCKRLVVGSTKDRFRFDGSIYHYDTNARCFCEDSQYKINFDNLQKNV